MKIKTNTKNDFRNIDWETVATFYASGDGFGPYLVEIQIAELEGRWYGHTTDDAGGSDDAPDEPIATSEEGAKEWAKSFADSHDEYPDEGAIAAEITSHDWWAREVTTEEILELAEAATDRQDGSYLWISSLGGAHWDSGNTLRVEGWDDYIIISASHNSRAAALISIRNSISE